MDKKELEEQLQKVVSEMLSDDMPVALERPRDTSYGDWMTNIAMRLASRLKQNPLEIAKRIVAEMGEISFDINIVPPGFINFSQPSDALQKQLQDILNAGDEYGVQPAKKQKIQVEHTALNINKAMHIGHLRNSCLGDSIARILKASGYSVEIMNKIDDTGAKVADALLGVKESSLDKKRYPKFDHYMWDVYTEIAPKLKTNESLREKRDDMLTKLDGSDTKFMKWAQPILDGIEKGHVETMSRLGIYYDVFISESVILRTKLWDKVRSELEKTGEFVKETSGDNKNAWVIKNIIVDPKLELKNPDKILVKSNGVTTYTGKDIALHMWKYGLVDTPWGYEDFAKQKNAKIIKRSCLASPDKGGGEFGGADIVVDIVDARQKYVMAVVGKALEKLGYSRQAKNYHHVAYEVVALSAKAAREFGVDTSDRKKYYAMEGSKGIGVKIDDLLDKTLEKVKKKQAESDREILPETAEQVAVAAVKFYLLKYNLNQVVVFDFDEALSFEGATGPYLQYTHARIQGISRKSSTAPPGPPPSPIFAKEEGEKLLIRKLAAYPDIVSLASRKFEPNHICNYLLELAQQFNSFYAKYPVLKAKPAERDFRLKLIAAVARVLRNGLGLLGIESPKEM